MKSTLIILIAFLTFSFVNHDEQLKASASPISQELIGAWEREVDQGTKEVLIIADGYWSATIFEHVAPEFISTQGGSWSMQDQSFIRIFEYHTDAPEEVGKKITTSAQVDLQSLQVGDDHYSRIDYGTPGALAGAYLITGRKRNGEMRSRTPGARKTMKILSGKRFQWIAYNTDTGEFFGTGGGTYTTVNGKYTENIDFFSRDNSRVGASLEFDFEMDLAKGEWHHSGLSSKGDPIYEIWTIRSFLGKTK